MESGKITILFVHEGLAIYPSMLACKAYFSAKGFLVAEVTSSKFDPNADYSRTILWMMMGFYPRRLAGSALAVIHEYRSPSVGRYRRLKDFFKKIFNHKPDLRLFQSEKIRTMLEKRDGTPSGVLGLGVPADILAFRAADNTPAKYDFCYIGAINEERNISLMLDGFIAAYGKDRSFILIGDVRDDIDNKYSMYPNLIFTGKLAQAEVFRLVNQSSYAVCYFPYHAPHCFQPPTKLYEYAALGRRIIINDSPANLDEVKRLGINAFVMRRAEFPDMTALGSLDDNMSFNASELLFDKLIESSGVEAFMNGRVSGHTVGIS